MTVARAAQPESARSPAKRGVYDWVSRIDPRPCG